MSQAADIEIEPAPQASLGSPPAVSRFSSLGDWLNPVLVKEIRQAQRGKVFSISLVVTVLLALLGCMLMTLDMASNTSRAGQEFFTLVYVFLCSAMLLIVPFQAFHAMGSEWDDHTFEMLVLSNLKPGQIVLGKILAAFVQTLLFFAAFLPFIAVAFLLRGVDMLVLAVVLGLTVYASLWFTTVSVMFSTLARNRFLRVLMMVVIAGTLVGMISGATAMASELMRRPDQIVDAEFWLALPQVLAMSSFVGLLAFFISCNLLAHEEENRSTNVRVLISVGTLIFLVLMVVNVSIPSSPLPREVVFGAAIFAVFAVAVAAVFICTEPEKLGRRVRQTVPKSRGLAMLTMPWFPGRGRGAVFLLLHLGALAAGAFALAPFARVLTWGGSVASGHSIMSTGGLGLLVAITYALLYTLVPIGVLLPMLAKNKRGRNATRVLALFSPFLFAFLPAVFSQIFGLSSNGLWRHPGNGPLMIEKSFTGHLYEADVFGFLVIPVVCIGLLLALPAMLAALYETSALSRANQRPKAPELSATDASAS